jgi:hypothetical protein
MNKLCYKTDITTIVVMGVITDVTGIVVVELLATSQLATVIKILPH